MERVGTRISRDLLDAVRRRAAEESRDEAEVIEDAVSRYLEDDNARWSRVGSISELFDEIAKWQRERGVEPLSDEEAMKLAVEEQHKFRRGE